MVEASESLFHLPSTVSLGKMTGLSGKAEFGGLAFFGYIRNYLPFTGMKTGSGGCGDLKCERGEEIHK